MGRGEVSHTNLRSSGTTNRNSNRNKNSKIASRSESTTIMTRNRKAEAANEKKMHFLIVIQYSSQNLTQAQHTGRDGMQAAGLTPPHRSARK